MVCLEKNQANCTKGGIMDSVNWGRVAAGLFVILVIAVGANLVLWQRTKDPSPDVATHGTGPVPVEVEPIPDQAAPVESPATGTADITPENPDATVPVTEPAQPQPPEPPDTHAAVQTETLGEVVYHAPGTYGSEVAGLDYSWELRFVDESAQWDWGMANADAANACQDALRAHMGQRPQWYGLQKADMVLHDPPFNFDPFGSPVNGEAFAYPLPADATIPDSGAVHVNCFNTHHMTDRHDDGEFSCTVLPLWGHVGTEQAASNLSAALGMAMATMLAYGIYQEEAIKSRHWLLETTWEQPPYLFPYYADTSVPAGEGPCRLTPAS